MPCKQFTLNFWPKQDENFEKEYKTVGFVTEGHGSSLIDLLHFTSVLIRASV